MQWMPHTVTDTEWMTSYNAMTATHWYRHSMKNIQCNERHTLTRTQIMQRMPHTDTATWCFTPYQPLRLYQGEQTVTQTLYEKHHTKQWMPHTLTQSLNEIHQTMQWMPYTDTDTEWKTSRNAMTATHWHSHWMKKSCNAMNATHWHSNLVFYAQSTITVISGRSDRDTDFAWNYIQCNECQTLT